MFVAKKVGELAKGVIDAVGALDKVVQCSVCGVKNQHVPDESKQAVIFCVSCKAQMSRRPLDDENEEKMDLLITPERLRRAQRHQNVLKFKDRHSRKIKLTLAPDINAGMVLHLALPKWQPPPGAWLLKAALAPVELLATDGESCELIDGDLDGFSDSAARIVSVTLPTPGVPFSFPNAGTPLQGAPYGPGQGGHPGLGAFHTQGGWDGCPQLGQGHIHGPCPQAHWQVPAPHYQGQAGQYPHAPAQSAWHGTATALGKEVPEGRPNDFGLMPPLQESSKASSDGRHAPLTDGESKGMSGSVPPITDAKEAAATLFKGAAVFGRGLMK
eukprot:TRINITY_DN26736_c0_g1_i1.p1 TRINITY_DN26736_c0_g1~~TRINITY_DN26736_c0_g1_i1.p1  ORF type:complete len:328 (+),score=35.15 TRINITY_DN26736_c0_g1_i1:86-1069(+)